MHKEVEKIVWKYLHNHIAESLEEGVTDSFMMSRCFDLVTKEYKKKFHEFPNGKSVIVHAAATDTSNGHPKLINTLKSEYGLNQEKIAQMIGCSQPFVSRCKLGLDKIPDDKLDIIHKFLKEAV